ncbi:Uncharacterised protein [Vibrio cholerae]|nr:Uncharacterised protein [Vibrio cholerae]
MMHPRGDVVAQFQLRQDEVDITAQCSMGMTQFVELGGINIDMNHFGMRRKGIELACHAVIKTRTNRDQQITLLYD